MMTSLVATFSLEVDAERLKRLHQSLSLLIFAIACDELQIAHVLDFVITAFQMANIHTVTRHSSVRICARLQVARQCYSWTNS